MMKANTVLGQWVPNEKMHPATNISGRDWMTVDGKMSGTMNGFTEIPIEAYQRGILWHFPCITKEGHDG